MTRRDALLAVLGLPVLLAADEPKKPPVTPEPNYTPKAGDRASLYTLTKKGEESTCWCATSEYAFKEYDKAIEIDDDDGLKELRDSGRVIRVASRTAILVLSERDEKTGAVEIRILEGPAKSRRLWTPVYHVARLIKKPRRP